MEAGKRQGNVMIEGELGRKVSSRTAREVIQDEQDDQGTHIFSIAITFEGQNQ